MKKDIREVFKNEKHLFTYQWGSARGRLADILIENGLDNFYEYMRSKSEKFNDYNRENDIFFW